MERRKLGKTDLELPVISYGASSLGQEFRRVTIEEALQSCRVALDLGMNFIDTSPFYGRGMSEVLLGQVLRAYVVGDVEPGEVRDWLRERIARYKVPKRVVVVSELPRNATGKVLKRHLLRAEHPSLG